MVLDKLPQPVPPQVTPTMIAAGVAGLQVIAALLVLFGFWTRTAAFILLVGTVGYFVFANDLWTLDAARKMINQNQALNLSLVGALLMLMAAGAEAGRSTDVRARTPAERRRARSLALAFSTANRYPPDRPGRLSETPRGIRCGRSHAGVCCALAGSADRRARRAGLLGRPPRDPGAPIWRVRYRLRLLHIRTMPGDGLRCRRFLHTQPELRRAFGWTAAYRKRRSY